MSLNRKEHLRYRYGKCLNDLCSKCKSKEVQQIPARKDFVCDECQKPLRECPPPRSIWTKYKNLILASIAIIVAIAITLLMLLMKTEDDKAPLDNGEYTGSETNLQECTDTIITEDAENIEKVHLTPEQQEDVTKEHKPVLTTISVPFGTYSGPANGLDGEIRVTRQYTLNLRNMAHETIELLPGDVITHTKFKNGELVGGYWHRGSETRAFHR